VVHPKTVSRSDEEAFLLSEFCGELGRVDVHAVLQEGNGSCTGRDEFPFSYPYKVDKKTLIRRKKEQISVK